MQLIKISILGILFALISVAIGQGETESSAVEVRIAEHEDFGTYLVDGEENSLYLFLNDGENTSNCYESCSENWPPLVVDAEPIVAAELDESMIGTFEREDGSIQVSYNSWPLYYFARDEDPGETNGQGAGDVWYLVSAMGDPLESGPTEAAETSDEGIFTEQQAARGKSQYTKHCESCHGDTLTGGQFGGPPIAGRFFFVRWGDRTVRDLHEYVSTEMPLGRPGTLSDQAYIDIVAYILEVNEYPAGDSELQADPESLQQIPIETQR